MARLLLIAAFSLAAGFAAGALMTSTPQAEISRAEISNDRSAQDSEYFDPSALTDVRIETLERVVTEERNARLILEEQLNGLFADFERIDVPELHTLLEQFAESRQKQERRKSAERTSAEAAARDTGRATRSYADQRADRLVSGGFADAAARRIVQLEDEVRMEALQEEYQARQSGSDFDPRDHANSYQRRVRDRLGDEQYARYLQSYGGSSTIVVREVFAKSPANRAGLRTGDQIVSYDGSRVFSMAELKDKAFGGEAGEDAIVEIERDGQRMQIVLPKGPIGISGRGSGVNYGNPFGG